MLLKAKITCERKYKLMEATKQKQVILISLDALGSTDFEDIRTLPNFARIIEGGAYCRRELSVFPSLTFPCHATISTGCRPAAHGIVSNYLMEPFSTLHHWNFYVKNLKRRALWDYAADAGKTVLSMSWPVSAGANIRYSMPEMTPAKPKLWNMQNFLRQMEVFRRYGTPAFAIHTLLSRPGLPKAWFFGEQPKLDKEMIEAFCAAIESYEFDIGLLHIYGMDDAKHVHGAHSPQAKEYLSIYDDFVGRLLDYQAQHSERDITIMLTGDHAQKDVSRVVYGNHLLERLGLCTFTNGSLSDYTAYLNSGDGMAYIYFKDGEQNQQQVQTIARLLRENPAVAHVLTPAEFTTLGCDPTAALVAVAADGFGFHSGFCDPADMDADCIADTPDRGLHGYLPTDPDYQTMFFCTGPSIRPQEISDMCITDITPTICQWLELSADPMDGQPVPELFLGGEMP